MNCELSANFNGLRVAALQSRNADQMQRMIEKFGGTAFVSPSMREVPIEPNRAAIDFAYQVITGEIGIVVFLTGVGFRQLLRCTEKHVDQQRFLAAASDGITVCRGPKPAAAMKEWGLTPTLRADEPNTWREVLLAIDQHTSVANQTVGIVEYGESNPSLIAGLEARGARVLSVRCYTWDFPLDIAPLQSNIRAIVSRERDVVIFTSAHQVVNLLRCAEQMNMLNDLRTALGQMVIASIGPTTSEMLRESDLAVDVEPEHSKMGHLVRAAAEQSSALLAQRRASRRPPTPVNVNPDRAMSDSVSKSNSVSSSDSVSTGAPRHPCYNSLFLKACRREATERTPIWLMRQAGRYMSEYRDVRSQTNFLDLCRNPALCSEVMCTAVDKLGVDAAIIFSDLLPILEPMGFELEFVKGDGPVIHNPIADASQIDRVGELEPLSMQFVYDTVRQTRADIDDSIPVIGFSGSPFTLASYAIEGGGSRTYTRTKQLMYRDLGAWRELMNRFTRAIIAYLNHQIDAGANCVQLFDSWVGCLSSEDYRHFILPHMNDILAGISPDVPVINFGTGNPMLLPMMRGDERTVVGVDWRVRLDTAWEMIGNDRSVQGNMEPACLLGSEELIRQRAAAVLQQAGARPGHIFNLGHGVLQQTPVENAIALVQIVKELSAR